MQTDSEDRAESRRFKGDCGACDGSNTSAGFSEEIVKITRVSSGRVSFGGPGGRSDEKRKSLCEICRQQRSMKSKYAKNRKSLLYFLRENYRKILSFFAAVLTVFILFCKTHDRNKPEISCKRK